MTVADDDPFLATCRGEAAAHIPVWFMRQAGRALPEYRAARGAGSILEAIRHPELAAELTLQPVRRYGVDAAILFSDIMVPVSATGFGVDIQPGVGPVVDRPFRSAKDLDRIRPLQPDEDLPYVAETVRILAKELDVPLIGFAGAPFTIASYLVEGRPSRDYVWTKRLMYTEPSLWEALVDRLADQAIASLQAQIAAGARAIQIFDSWVGALDRADYERFVRPATTRIMDVLSDTGVPRIHFGVNTGHLLESIAATGADVVGVDWRTSLAEARTRIGADRTLQGNLDPVAVLAGWDAARAKATEALQSGGGHRHIFNLGHGVLPETDPDVLTRVVELVHTFEPPPA